jgi:outer membrane protein OmpA-like peptidoglycan-associated protein
MDSLIKNCTIKEINIEAHCDSMGSYKYNDTLSIKRALVVKQYFISQGVADNIIKTFAKGERYPLTAFGNTDIMNLNRCAIIYFTTIKKPHIDTTTFDISNLEVGSSFTLKNLKFKDASTDLLPGSKPTLLTLLKTLNKYPAMEIEIQGYVCCFPEGKDGYDAEKNTRDLSKRRAKLIYEYLVKCGIDPKRLTYKGYGGNNKIIAIEKTLDDMAVNRRVEIKITKK